MSKEENEEKKIFEKVAGFFEKLGVNCNHEIVENKDGTKDNIITTEYETCGRVFPMVIMVGDGRRGKRKWINIKTRVVRFSESEEMKDNYKLRAEMYQMCLFGNFAFNEVTFSCDELGDIYVEADMLAKVDFEYFKVDFESIAIGIDYLLEEVGLDKYC